MNVLIRDLDASLVKRIDELAKVKKFLDKNFCIDILVILQYFKI